MEAGIDVGDRLITLIRQNYQPKKAVLVVISSQNLSAHEKWVESLLLTTGSLTNVDGDVRANQDPFLPFFKALCKYGLLTLLHLPGKTTSQPTALPGELLRLQAVECNQNLLRSSARVQALDKSNPYSCHCYKQLCVLTSYNK